MTRRYTTQVRVAVTPRLRKKLEEAAEERGERLSTYVRRALREAVGFQPLIITLAVDNLTDEQVELLRSKGVDLKC